MTDRRVEGAGDRVVADSAEDGGHRGGCAGDRVAGDVAQVHAAGDERERRVVEPVFAQGVADGDGRGRLRGVDEVVAGRGHDDAAGTGERAVVQVGQGAGAGQPAAGFTDPGRSPDPPGVARRQGRAGRVLQQSGSDQVDVVDGGRPGIEDEI